MEQSSYLNTFSQSSEPPRRGKIRKVKDYMCVAGKFGFCVVDGDPFLCRESDDLLGGLVFRNGLVLPLADTHRFENFVFGLPLGFIQGTRDHIDRMSLVIVLLSTVGRVGSCLIIVARIGGPYFGSLYGLEC